MTIFSILQSIIAILLIVLIMLQQRGTALGSAFGGGDSGGGGFYSTRRGIQKKMLWATVVLGTIFVALAVLNLII